MLERIFPAHPLPKISWWTVKGFLGFVVSGMVNTFIPALVAEAVTKVVKPIDFTFLGLAGALVVLAVSDVVSYPVHRFLHRFDFVWRWTHQMHHSAERFDVVGGVYFHPFDLLVQVAMPTFLVALLGVTPDAAALAGYLGFFIAIFQHLNVKTPRWLGYFVLRPEQHSVHHARGVHAYNYGNLAFMDLLFGTFRNPKEFSPEQGFYEGSSRESARCCSGATSDSPSVVLGSPFRRTPPPRTRCPRDRESHRRVALGSTTDAARETYDGNDDSYTMTCHARCCPARACTMVTVQNTTPGYSRVSLAKCPANKKAVGGGVSTTSAVKVTGSYPSSADDAWTCKTYDGNNDSYTMTCYAICCDAP